MITTFYSSFALSFEFTKEICQEYGLGSSWYCEQENQNNQDINPEEIMNMQVPSEQKAILLNQLWETQNKRAVISGKKEDLEQLLITQNFIAKKATDFARNMTRLVETTPTFSNSESYYKNIAAQYVEQLEKDNLLKTAKDRYSLAMVYSSSCPYCKQQVPILLSLKAQTGMSIIGVSIDGGFYSEFEANVFDANVANDPSILAYPTILLIDNKNLKRLFVAKGLTTKDELENRIYKTIKESSDHDQKPFN